MKKNEDVVSRIIVLIDKLKPFLINDGGNREFVNYENNIVFVWMMGACKECEMMDITLKEGIEEIIVNEIPEVKEVRNIDWFYNQSIFFIILCSDNFL